MKNLGDDRASPAPNGTPRLRPTESTLEYELPGEPPGGQSRIATNAGLDCVSLEGQRQNYRQPNADNRQDGNNRRKPCELAQLIQERAPRTCVRNRWARRSCYEAIGHCVSLARAGPR